MSFGVIKKDQLISHFRCYVICLATVKKVSLSAFQFSSRQGKLCQRLDELEKALGRLDPNASAGERERERE